MTRRAWILMLSLAALWGASYMFIEITLDGGLSSTFLVFARTALGALVLAPVALSRGAFAPARRHLPTLGLIALVQITGPFLLITIGQHHVTSSMAGILIASAPIFTTIIAAFYAHDDRLGPGGIAGIVVGILGVGLLFGVDLSGDATTLLAGGGILLAGLGYAIGATLSKRRLHDVPPIGVAASIIGLGALSLAPLAPFTAPSTMPTLGTWAALVVLGAGGTGVAFLIFYVLNADVGPSRASVVAYIAPFFSVIYGVTLLDEPFSLGTAAGLVLILAGSWMAADGRVPWRRGRTSPLAEQPA
ncbi:MAG TPA: DMT family transporter [Solirubrobacteraceae bacterium]|nr:DMT family transporter [Solirubrobacteraceae bacterium]